MAVLQLCSYLHLAASVTQFFWILEFITALSVLLL